MFDDIPINVLPDDDDAAVRVLLDLVKNAMVTPEQGEAIWKHRHTPRDPNKTYHVLGRKNA
jgi:hypothetical protein